MNTLNSLIIEGKIKDFLDNGVVIESIRHYKNADGDDKEEKSEFDVICYGNLLVALLKYGKKAGGIRIVGRLKLTRWNDGDKMCSKVVIIAEHIEFKKIKSLISLLRWNEENGKHTTAELLEDWKNSKEIAPYYNQLIQALNAPQIEKKGGILQQSTLNPTEAPKAPQKTVISVTTLEKYIKAGIKLIPTKPNQEGNFYQLKKDGELIKIDSLQGLKYWIDHGIERFIFIPKEAGFLCFNLDRNHNDGADGVNNFYSWLKDNGLEQIPLFKNLDGGSFPTYTTTASGGLHLYFKCTGELKTFATIAPGVEIKYNGLNITAGGSVKNGKAYSLHGELNKAPIIPAPLLLKLSKVLSKEPPKQKPKTWGNQAK